MTSLEKQPARPSLDLAFESIDSCMGYIDHLTLQINKLAGLYNQGHIQAANNSFSEIIEFMDLYIQLFSKIYRVLRMELKHQDFKSNEVQALEVHLLSIMKSLLQAKEKDDHVMISDLLEYELVANLDQWKIKILPELKKLKNY